MQVFYVVPIEPVLLNVSGVPISATTTGPGLPMFLTNIQPTTAAIELVNEAYFLWSTS